MMKLFVHAAMKKKKKEKKKWIKEDVRILAKVLKGGKENVRFRSEHLYSIFYYIFWIFIKKGKKKKKKLYTLIAN